MERRLLDRTRTHGLQPCFFLCSYFLAGLLSKAAKLAARLLCFILHVQHVLSDRLIQKLSGKQKKEEGEVYIYTVLFDGRVDDIYNKVDIRILDRTSNVPQLITGLLYTRSILFLLILFHSIHNSTFCLLSFQRLST